jgi:hypothetical protein
VVLSRSRLWLTFLLILNIWTETLMAVCLLLTDSVWAEIEPKLTPAKTRLTVYLTWRMSAAASCRLRSLHYNGT